MAQKKIIIFTCTGGHETAAQALKEYLGSQYQVEIKNVFEDVLKKIDLIRFLTFGKYDSQDLYNCLLKRHSYTFINHFLVRGYAYYTWRNRAVQKLFNAFFAKNQYDLIISVIPLFNKNIAIAAKQQNTPILLIPTDFDATFFVRGLKSIKGSADSLYLGLMIDNLLTRKTMQHVTISQKAIFEVGPVLRSAFFEKKSQSEIKKEFEIPQNKKVVLLIMGSQGSDSALEFCRNIIKTKQTFHLVVVLGKNSRVRSKIERLHFPHTISKTIFNFTDRVADLMSITDLLITKSGGMSVMEGIGMRLPMILDATSEILLWEQKNQEFIIKHKLGVALKKYADLPTLITTMLHPNEQQRYYDRFRELNVHKTREQIVALVDKLIGQ